MRPETWPVAQQSALAHATRAAVMGNLDGGYGYAILHYSGEIEVNLLPNREGLLQAMADVYTHKGRWRYPQSWERVLFFAPEMPFRMFLVIEESEVDS
jgi:hypothetical protein